MENNESRFDFRCDAKLSDKDLIRGKCYERYEKQYSKFSIPVYGFVIVNFSVVAIVAVIYSKCIESTVDELEARNADAEGQAQHGNGTRRRLFIAYCCQLAIRFALFLIFFIVLQAQVLYPSKFPSDFECAITREGNRSAYPSANLTQTQTYECHNQRATKKTFWTGAVTVVNGIFTFIVLMEIVWIMSRARNGRKFMEDSHFFADHLKSNSLPMQQQADGQNTQESHLLQGQPGELQDDQQNQDIPQEQEPPHKQSRLEESIKIMKDNIIKETEKPSGFEQPTKASDPGEGPPPEHLKIDQIYVNLVICEDRAYYDFPEDRDELLKVYPKPANVKQTRSVRPEDIIDAEHKNVLVVGRPGIGKTIMSTKLLRTWASDKALHFDVAFLLKFRRFNSFQTKLNFRELLECSEYVEHIDDKLWDYIIENPTKVLLIFDGLDEFSGRSDIGKDHFNYKNNVEVKMPLHCLYNKIVSRKLLDGATVITTTRPTAAKCVSRLNFDQIFEILGFRSLEVKEYVRKFTEDEHDADKTEQTIWQHISSNINLFSLCYIPANCFIICSCLLGYLRRQAGASLPSKITEIYKIAVIISYFRHNDKNQPSTTESDEYIGKPIHELPEEMLNVLERLGEIAFKGIEEGRLIFGKTEVDGLENCGLLHKLPKRKNSGSLIKQSEDQFCFNHLTIQEFLAARHVIDTRNEEELRDLVKENINKGAWQVVLQFVAGLLEEDPHRKVPNSGIFTELLPMSTVEKKDDWDWRTEDSEARTFTWWPAYYNEKQLALNLCRCLNEIDVKQDPAIQNKLTEIGFNAVDFSKCSLAPVDCSAVLNVLKNATGILGMDLEVSNIGLLGCIEIKNWIVDSDDSDNKYCKLNSLDLSGNDITIEGVKYLALALTNSNCKLNSLDLRVNNITDEGIEHLAEALMNSNCKLNSLDLSGNDITDEGAKHLAEALMNSNCILNSLDLTFNIIIDEGVKHLAEALTNSNCKLNSLGLSRNYISDEGVKHLAEALTNSNCKLNSLDLRVNMLTDEGIEHLAEALMNSNCKLNSLDLSGNDDRTDEGIKHLAEALMNSNCNLNSLDLCGNDITNEGVKHLAEALTNSNCKLNSLDLTFNRITDEAGVKHLAEALTNSNCKLNSLRLARNDITDEGAKHLAEALMNINCILNSLDLTFNRITDEGVKHLAEALTNSNCKLNSLGLSINYISDEGVKHLAEALTNSNCKLNSLRLARNDITDEGKKHLAEALTHINCKLNRLDLIGNNITDKDVKYLAEAQHNCKSTKLIHPSYLRCAAP